MAGKRTKQHHRLEEGFEAGKISYISEEVYTAFVEAVKKESVLGDTQVNKDVAIVYSPLNGTGLKPVIRTLKESGYTNITVVKEQEQPDGTFPKEDSYIFGMEESYGYLSGSYVRDKDGVNAAFLICEMFTYYASQGIGLFEKSKCGAMPDI